MNKINNIGLSTTGNIVNITIKFIGKTESEIREEVLELQKKYENIITKEINMFELGGEYGLHKKITNEKTSYIYYDRLNLDEKLYLAKTSNDVNILKGLIDDNLSCHVYVANKDRENNWTKEKVAQNPNTPKDILKTLSSSKDPSIRAGVAKNINCPKNILKILSKDFRRVVRINVSENPNCSKKLKNEILKDKTSNLTYFVSELTNIKKEDLYKKTFKSLIKNNENVFYSLGVLLDEIKNNKEIKKGDEIWMSNALFLKSVLYSKLYPGIDLGTIIRNKASNKKIDSLNIPKILKLIKSDNKH